MDRYVPATALGGRLYVEEPAQDEAVVDMLVLRVGHRKVRTARKLDEVVRASKRNLPSGCGSALKHIGRGQSILQGLMRLAARGCGPQAQLFIDTPFFHSFMAQETRFFFR